MMLTVILMFNCAAGERLNVHTSNSFWLLSIYYNLIQLYINEIIEK